MDYSQETLLAEIESHLWKTGQTAASFGRRVANDPGLVRGLRRGRSPRLRLAETIMAVIGAERANVPVPGQAESQEAAGCPAPIRPAPAHSPARLAPQGPQRLG
jgi:hypothetical protein